MTNGTIQIDKLNSPELSPVTRAMLHEQIYEMLSRNLMMGRFSPGQKLPLRGLAKSLGTSLMPVRDALQRLESVGSVVLTPQRTLMVPLFTSKELHDISVLRKAIESAALERAVVNRSKYQLDQLNERVKDICKAEKNNDIDLFLEANYHFHMIIADMSDLSFIRQSLEPIWMKLGPTVRQSVPDDDLFRSSAQNHIDMYEAIAAKDGEAALRALHRDISEGYSF
ncbi:MAG: GntR family transcriptional regulator [Rhizobiaceae bacterium]|nr:GntR family transcriptional regulator [Rhizobiaceae bacterium]